MTPLLVRDIMTTRVLSVAPTTSIREAARLMMDAHVSGLPVVDDEGAPIGILSKTDLLDRVHNEERAHGMEKLYYRAAFGQREPITSGFHVDGELDGTVEEAMTPLVMKVPSSMTMEQAARIMAFEAVHRLLVVEDYKLVGIVTTMDVVRAVAGLSRHEHMGVPCG